MFRPGGSIKLMRVAGIRIGVDATWFVLLFVAIFVVSGPFRDELGSSDLVAYVTTVATVLLFFLSLILHELGHALAARRAGIDVSRIELFLFGGLTQMSRDSQSPGEEFKIAAAGPLATLVVAIICAAGVMVIVGPHRWWQTLTFDSSARVTPVLLALSWLLTMNVAILVFNVLPAYPLDGGRILRAAVWQRTHNKLAGTRAAAKLGQWLAILGAGGGVFVILNGDVIDGVWLILVAWLIYNSAHSTLRGSAFNARMSAVRVADIMERNPVTIVSAQSARQALDDGFSTHDVSWLPVVDESGHYLGITRRERVQSAADGGQESVTVASILDADDGSSRVFEDTPLSELLRQPALRALGGLVAVDGDGVVSGVVTAEALRRALASLLPERN